MIKPITIFVDGAVLCSFPFEFKPYFPSAWYSKALFCPDCGEVWARFIVPGHSFYCAWVQCPRHGDIGLDSASLTQPIAVVEYQHALPAEVWNYDLRTWAQQYDNWAEVFPIFLPFNLELSHAA